VEFLAVMAVIAVVALVVAAQLGARQQLRVETQINPSEARSLIEGSFGPMWRKVQGPGDYNYMPRARKGAPTLSIDCAGAGSGSTVDLWMSQSAGGFGIANHALLIWRKKRKLASRLSQ
jgi:hypothetical protein